jgi:selenocysteine lyase/cysteine desulfurase
MEFSRRDLFRIGGASAAASMASSVPGWGSAQAQAMSATLPAKGAFHGVADQIFLNAAADHPWHANATKALKAYADTKLEGSGSGRSALAKFATLINAGTDEVTYVPSTSMGEYLVTKSLGLPESGGRVVTDALHFIGSFYMYEQYRLSGLDVVTVDMDSTYRIPVSAMEQAITPGTKLVAISHVSLYNGFTHDVRTICDIAHSRGALVYVDLIQSAGSIPVDVKAMGVDFAACGTYKWLMGDFGFAFLYVNKELLPVLKRPWYGYRQTRNFASPILHVYPLDPPGSVPYQSVPINSVSGYFMGSFPATAVEAACAASIDWIQFVGVQQIQAYKQPMLAALQAGLRQRGWQVVTPPETKASIVTVAYPNASVLAPRLDPYKISITLRANYARVSPSVYNDMNDIQAFLDAFGSP